jgi:hypothetical protein
LNRFPTSIQKPTLEGKNPIFESHFLDMLGFFDLQELKLCRYFLFIREKVCAKFGFS